MALHFNFNYKNHNYNMTFYPCEYMANISKDTGTVSRDILFNAKLKFTDFLKKLETINFCENM